MPKLQEVGMDVVPQGQIQADRFQQANPEDFGQQTGQAIEQAGQGAATANQDAIAVENDKARIVAGSAAAQATVDGAQMLQAARNDPNFAKKYGADGSGFAAGIDDQFTNYAQTAVANMPTPEAQRFLDQHLGEVHKQVMDEALKYQSSVGADWQVSQLNGTLNNFTTAVAANPANYQAYKSQMNDIVQNTPNLPQDLKIKLTEAAGHDMAVASATSSAKNQPEAWIAAHSASDLAALNPTGKSESQVGGMVVQNPVVVTGTDTVSAYKPERVAEVAQAVKAPSQYDDLLNQAAKQWGVDPQELKMKMIMESDGKPDANSGKAGGLMGITPANFKALGGTDITNPAQNIQAGAMLLADAKAAGKGDNSKVDMNYYGGPNSAQWGMDTQQYAANAQAVRQTLNGDTGTNPMSLSDAVAASQIPKDAIKVASLDNTGYNDLSWAEQQKVTKDAIDAIDFKNKQAEHLQTMQEKAKEMAGKQKTSDAIEAIDKGTLDLAKFVADPDVTAEQKILVKNAVHNWTMGNEASDPKVAIPMYEAARKGDLTQAEADKAFSDGKLGKEDWQNISKSIGGEETPGGKLDNSLSASHEAYIKSALGAPDFFNQGDPKNAEIVNRALQDYNEGLRQARTNNQSVMSIGMGQPHDIVTHIVSTYKALEASRDADTTGTPAAIPMGFPGLPTPTPAAPSYVDITGADDPLFKTMKQGTPFRLPDGRTGKKP